MMKPSRDDEGYLRGWFLVETHGNYKRAREMARQHSGEGYTQHKLTESQLKFLSQIINGRQRNNFGPTLAVLERHGLIEPDYTPDGVDDPWDRQVGRKATQAGVEALAQARAEGW